AGHHFVFHLAANADVRFGTQHPGRDLEQNTVATFQVLEAMRAGGVRRLAFSSTGSVYGEPEVFPTPEGCPFPAQTSLYGASKLAGEGLVAAYCTGFGFQGYVFRFVSILGERYTHGHVYDFFNKLRRDPRRVEVLGNGRQRKSYLDVQDCIDAMLTVIDKSPRPYTVANLGTDEYCCVDDSLGWICAHLGERYTHGHVYDFFNKLRRDPRRVEVLGNGRQRKSYLDVQDCIDAMLTVIDKSPRPYTVANLGTDEYCCVDDSLGWICAHLG